MNYTIVQKVIGKLLLAYALTMIIPLGIGVFYQEKTLVPFLISIGLTTLGGSLLLFQSRRNRNEKLGIRDSFVIVAGAWIITSIFGALPFWLADSVPTYIDALFESVSGLTTTGSSVIENIETLPYSILFWRSLNQWLGGMGIIVLFIILLPNTGFGAVQLYNAEVSGPLSKRVMPKVRDTASAIWKIYGLLTLILIGFLFGAGMKPFDAIVHGFSTISTGGFSTQNNSVMAFGSFSIEMIIVGFIIIAGGNFRIYLESWNKKTLKPFKNTEFIVYLGVIFIGTLAVFLLSLFNPQDLGVSLRQSLFQVTSLLTGTGYASANYDLWPSASKIILFFLMFVGGCAGSTTGGIKISRMILLLKISWSVLKRGIHPNIVDTIKLDGKVVDSVAINLVSIFFFLYIFIFGLGTILLASTGLEPFEAMSAVVASLSNVGPGFEGVGPLSNYGEISLFGKSVIILCMLLGRLELFTLLILLRPEFWKPKKGW
ncbi:MAG: TrkH family potassium uptake protein [Desulfitobacterium sp.]|nr:TrkH family potassium uptake protein [Desulfitobacterium sp.]